MSDLPEIGQETGGASGSGNPEDAMGSVQNVMTFKFLVSVGSCFAA